MRRFVLALGFVMGVALLGGCTGYQIGSVKPAELGSIDRIAVPVFKNKTLEPRSSVPITNNVIKQFQNDGTFSITTTANADAVLRGVITKIERRQLRSARFNALRSRELAIRLFVDYTLEEGGSGIILAEGSAQGRTNVFLDPNIQRTERQALDEASREVAESIVAKITEGW